MERSMKRIPRGVAAWRGLRAKPLWSLLAADKAPLFMALMQELNEQQGKTIVFVTHEPDIASFSSRTIQLRDGHIQKDTKNEGKRSAREVLDSFTVAEDYWSIIELLNE